MELQTIMKPLIDKKRIFQNRRKFLKEINKALQASYNINNITYGNVDSTKHLYEFQIMINPHDFNHGSMMELKKVALNCNFKLQRDLSGTVSELTSFINSAFRHNKLWIKCTKSMVGNYDIDVIHSRVHLDDPRKYNPKAQYGLNFWVQFKMTPRVQPITRKRSHE